MWKQEALTAVIFLMRIILQIVASTFYEIRWPLSVYSFYNSLCNMLSVCTTLQVKSLKCFEMFVWNFMSSCLFETVSLKLCHWSNDCITHIWLKRNVSLKRNICLKRNVCLKRDVCLKRNVSLKRNVYLKRNISLKRNIYLKRYVCLKLINEGCTNNTQNC